MDETERASEQAPQEAPEEEPEHPPPRKSRPVPLWQITWSAGFIFVALCCYVRGPVVGPAPNAAVLDGQLRFLAASPPWIQSLEDIQQLGAVAAGLVAQRGIEPGTFHVDYLARLDLLEKFHHLIHAPFTGMTRIYCDIWVNSITTYGADEATWGFSDSKVRRSLKLPILMLLLDRLARGRSTLTEYLCAPFEEFSGMAIHTFPGRVQAWHSFLLDCRKFPQLVPFVKEQLSRYELVWTDLADVHFFAAVSQLPAAGVWRRLTHDPPSVDLTRQPMDLRSWPALAERLLSQLDPAPR
jgi:hypothetical protein